MIFSKVRNPGESNISDSFPLGKARRQRYNQCIGGPRSVRGIAGMKRAITITSMLLLAAAVSCREADDNQDAADRLDRARQAFKAARDMYGSGRDYAAAEKQFLDLLQTFAQTRYADPSRAYLHACRAYMAVEAKDWTRAQKEMDIASCLIRKIRENNPPESSLYKCAMIMKDDIPANDAARTRRKAFAEVMGQARKLYDQGQYDRAGALLNAEYCDPDPLPYDLKQELQSFKNKLLMAGWDGKRASDTILAERVRKQQARDALYLKARALYDRGQLAQALPLFEELKKRDRSVRDYRDKIRDCKYQLELIVFKEAVAAGDYEKAKASGEKARAIYPDGYANDIETRLMEMQATRKAAAILAKGAEALKNGQYSDARKILDPLKDSYPEAKEMVRQSRYRENIAKGDAARKAGDFKTALAMYKVAKKYAKTPAEHKVLDALIAAAAKAL